SHGQRFPQAVAQLRHLRAPDYVKRNNLVIELVRGYVKEAACSTWPKHNAHDRRNRTRLDHDVPRSHSGNRTKTSREIDEDLKSSVRQHPFLVMRRPRSVVVPKRLYIGSKRWSWAMSRKHHLHQNTRGRLFRTRGHYPVVRLSLIRAVADCTREHRGERYTRPACVPGSLLYSEWSCRSQRTRSLHKSFKSFANR